MKTKKKVLMLVHTFPPFGSVGGSVRLVKFLRYLAEDGYDWEPTIITLDPDVDLLWLPKDATHSLEELPDGVRMIRTGTSEPRSPAFKSDFLNRIVRKIKLALLHPMRRFLLVPDDKKFWRKHLEAAAEKELASGDYSLIYATAPPYSVLLGAVSLKKKTGLPLVIDIKDDWLVEQRFRGINKYRKLIDPPMERRCVEAADKVITVTQHSCDEYSQRYPQYPEKFELIHNGCDVEEYKQYWEQRPEKFHKFTLIHTGVFSSRRDMSALFSALRRFCDEHPQAADRIEYMIVGNIPADQMALIEKFRLKDVVRSVGYMDRDLYVETLVKAHLPVVVNYSVSSLIPGKLYEYWGSRNRMLLMDTQHSAAAEIVKRYDIGSVVDPDDAEGIYQVINRAFSDWEEGHVQLADVSQLHLFSRRHLTSRLDKVFAELVGDQ